MRERERRGCKAAFSEYLSHLMALRYFFCSKHCKYVGKKKLGPVPNLLADPCTKQSCSIPKYTKVVKLFDKKGEMTTNHMESNKIVLI